ncbi:MAG: hypothetical protein M0R74_19915, partial [Dehalococcoidia bacterium]|nr:hypothetical protein [Dehalococcoidia bacterium]
MDRLYRDASVLVRLTLHDGTSFMALEALSRGRYVIWTYPMPGVEQAQGPPAVTSALLGLWKRHEAGDLGLNEEGMVFAREHFDPGRVAGQIDGRLRDLIRRLR